MPDDADYETTRELIQGLLLEAGSHMEFESANLALILPTTHPKSLFASSTYIRPQATYWRLSEPPES